jgi:hypothetical protein
MTTPELNSARRRDPEPRGSIGAHLNKKVWSKVIKYVATPKLTSIKRCGPKLHFILQHVNTLVVSLWIRVHMRVTVLRCRQFLRRIG